MQEGLNTSYLLFIAVNPGTINVSVPRLHDPSRNDYISPILRENRGETVVQRLERSGGQGGRNGSCADLDGGVHGVADDAGTGLPGAEPHRGDLGAGVEHEMPRHLCLAHDH